MRMTQRQFQLIEAQIGAMSDGARAWLLYGEYGPAIEPAQDIHQFAGGGWLDRIAFFAGSIAGTPRRVCPSIAATR